ncbi:glutamate--tRNA ligase [archaeon]|nr:glutamate--tRNA ligase [archaeon]|tara:strand:- start:9175 stop:10800 length:1626 start_codon:yes stop_codon:yes gene_type:complete
MNLKDKIFMYAIQNATSYNGKANPKAVIGKVFSENPKTDKKALFKQINEIVSKVNSMSLEEQQVHLQDLPVYEKPIIEKKLPDLKNPKKVIMRFAPNPNGAMSLGHSRVAILNSIYTKNYKGKFILRIDDTDPKVKVPLKEAYKWFEEDLKWLNIKPSKIIKQSERFPIYYRYAKKLIQMDKTYVCTCSVLKKRKSLWNKESCPCRELSIKETAKRFEEMFTKYREGEAVLRIKTDLENKDPALRDWPAFRIVNKSQHPLDKKTKVWPLLNFASAIDDHELKITHILRGIDLLGSEERQKFIYKYFNWKYPETIYHGKLLIKGIKSTSEIAKLIKEKKLTGWDDPKLTSIKTLRKKGIKAQAIINFMEDIGITRNDINVSLDALFALNKEIIDKEANRYFSILEPKKIKIKNAPSLTTELDLHPDFKRGKRKFTTSNEFYIQDKLNKKQHYRLIGLFNFQNQEFTSKELESDLEAQLIHWLPVQKDLIKIELIYPDQTVKGLVEKSIKKQKPDDIVQLVRIGFARIDEITKDKITLYFTHK